MTINSKHFIRIGIILLVIAIVLMAIFSLQRKQQQGQIQELQETTEDPTLRRLRLLTPSQEKRVQALNQERRQRLEDINALGNEQTLEEKANRLKLLEGVPGDNKKQ